MLSSSQIEFSLSIVLGQFCEITHDIRFLFEAIIVSIQETPIKQILTTYRWISRTRAHGGIHNTKCQHFSNFLIIIIKILELNQTAYTKT